MNLEEPSLDTTVKKKTVVLIWKKDHYEDASGRYSTRIDLNRYHFLEWDRWP